MTERIYFSIDCLRALRIPLTTFLSNDEEKFTISKKELDSCKLKLKSVNYDKVTLVKTKNSPGYFDVLGKAN